MKYYLAYGSNLSVRQMSRRCPSASCAGRGFIKDHRLLFRLGVLTIEPHKGSEVPVLVWQVTPDDEKALDSYEGWPEFYRKENTVIEILSLETGEVTAAADAFVYVMNEGFEPAPPTKQYWDICMEGYRRFGFDEEILKKALIDSLKDE